VKGAVLKLARAAGGVVVKGAVLKLARAAGGVTRTKKMWANRGVAMQQRSK
jgi:hypothetical protein